MSVNVSLKRWGGMEGEAGQVDSPVSVTFGRALPDPAWPDAGAVRVCSAGCRCGAVPGSWLKETPAPGEGLQRGT